MNRLRERGFDRHKAAGRFHHHYRRFPADAQARLDQALEEARAAIEAAGVGFYQTLHGGTPIHAEAIDELGRSFALLSDGLRIKPYPCGGLTHQAIDAVLEFRAKHGLTADMIESINVDVTKHTFERIIFKVPQSGIQGKFCMPYLLARAIIDGRVSLDHFTDTAVREASVLKNSSKLGLPSVKKPGLLAPVTMTSK